MTSHDAFTSGTSRALTVASFQWLKIEALIPSPADCEVRSVIKFLNAKSMAPIEIHRQLCQVYGHTRLDGQHISCRSSDGWCLISMHPISRTSRPAISIFSYTSRNSCSITSAFSEWQRGEDECHTVVPIHGRLARWIKWRACDVGESKEGLKNELWRRWSNGRLGEWAVT